jgi:hypothetical protein
MNTLVKFSQKKFLVSLSLLAVSAVGVSCKSKTTSDSPTNTVIQPAVGNPQQPSTTQPAAAPAPAANNPFSAMASQILLKPVDFEVYDRSAVIQRDSNQMISALSGRPEFYANMSGLANSAPFQTTQTNSNTLDSCLSARLNVPGKVISIDKEFVVLSIDDSSRCAAETQFSNKEIYYVRCVGVDLSPLKDKPAREILSVLDFKTGLCKSASEIHMFSNAKSLATAPVANGQPGFNQDTSRAIMTSTGEPCVYKRQDKVVTLVGECMNYYLVKNQVTAVQNSQTTNYVDRRLTKQKDLVQEPESNQPWFTSGNIEINENGWNGTLAYSNKLAPRANLKHENGAFTNETLVQKSWSQASAYGQNTQSQQYGYNPQYQGSGYPVYSPCYDPNPRLSVNFFLSGGQSALGISYSSGQTGPCYGTPPWNPGYQVNSQLPAYGQNNSYPSQNGNPSQTYVYY